MAGYQKIAENVKIKILPDWSPADIAEAMTLWLGSKHDWLLVIDNLDDVKIVDGFLPRNGPKKHTLITTRNRHPTHIPAEGLEIPELESQDSVNLLSILSGITVQSDSEERQQAEQTVKDLHYLPLAIEQAGAYIKAVTGDFASFSKLYASAHKYVHEWKSKSDRSYPHSIATTWTMSVNVRQKYPEAVRLFQLLCFLNPDEILVEFLESGVNFDPALQELVLNQNKMAKALLELEKFSLLKWVRPAKTLSVHRNSSKR